jgi:hypothetical protein
LPIFFSEAAAYSEKRRGKQEKQAPPVLAPCLGPSILPKFYYAKRRFSVTSKCRQMHGVLNVDEIKN